MAAEIDDITITFEENGIEVVKQLDRAVLTKGAWCTIMFKYRQWEPTKEAYSPIKYSIRRYRKMKGEYRQQSKFNISSEDQAKKVIATLNNWLEQDQGQLDSSE